jgi:hypothetical protein
VDERLSGWELRLRAEEETGRSVSGEQLADFVAWGLLPESPAGGWVPTDVERLVQIWELGKCVRPLHRRVVLLRDVHWPTPPGKLREAMVATIPSITAPARKMRNLYRALHIVSGEMTPSRAGELRVPPEWRLPPLREWQALFDWPNDHELELLAGPVYSQAKAAELHPGVQASGLLTEVPFEELVILLMTRQLTIATTWTQPLPPPIEEKPR